ncbi:hypothetical protein BDP27DRAFT_1263572 [Rhodocollybia butyracea]|uniref:Early meiotic induction protein 1 n=1 Tax=Rhodocollybia butyracea TaxID=206335 RepID=A0A9P5U974_9AGAR|nr:hypothetical protein BDP27DRAFT_1263572 [Rhodocollybia butyracea]
MSNLDFEKTVKQEEAYLRLVHPTPEETPTCINLFDTLLSCNAIRSQVKSFYRFGERTHCGQKLEDFKFCLGLTRMEPDERRDIWIRRRAEWWANRRLAKSSEDVWQMRDAPLKDFPKVMTDEDIRESTSTAVLT